MSINLGLDGLRKAVIRSNLFLNDLPGETKSLGNAMFQQRIALKAATLSDEVNQRHRKEGLKLSEERLQQIARQRTDERRQQASERRQTLSKGLDNVGQRYQAGQAVVDKVSSVSSRAMGVASFGAKLLKPGYEQATAGTAAVSAASGAAVAPQADNLAGDIGQLNAAIDSISLTVFTQLDGTLRSLTQTATGLLTGVDQWIQDNPTLAGGITQLVAGGGLLIAALGGIGSVVVPVLSGLNLLMAGAGILSGVFTFAGGAIVAALGAITLPVGIAIAAIVGAAALIYQYWEPLSAFFGGVVEGISAVLTPLFEAFKPLTVIFDEAGKQIDSAFDSIKAFFSPIEMTAQKLEQLGNLGRFVGEALVNGLSLPLTILRTLGGKVSWLLEKLGLADKKAADADALLDDDPSAQRPSVALGGADFAAPDTPAPVAFGGARYQPVTAGSASNSQQNTFNSSYVINVPTSMGEAEVRTMIDNHQQQTQARAAINQRSSFWGQ
ncbi:phage tail tape measure protein [Erwinia sp. JH02]|uniref:phage tail tape measure protein n=1 Tax=Erwinia sp. JH02 TaxID=2733394 RepID=UPI0014887488|nr:phage tail tape measure protein [Erwinia sp. JH02]NNS08065.1 phage tail tape measure protein [Erwinia sp. JH02]